MRMTNADTQNKWKMKNKYTKMRGLLWILKSKISKIYKLSTNKKNSKTIKSNLTTEPAIRAISNTMPTQYKII